MIRSEELLEGWNIKEAYPPRGLFEARRGKFFFVVRQSNRRGGVHKGAAELIAGEK
jgi:hypothetical protein